MSSYPDATNATPARSCSLAARWARLRYLVRSDLHRYGEGSSFRVFCRHYLRNPGFRFTAWHRFRCALTGIPGMRLGFAQWVSWQLHEMEIRFGITIPIQAELGPGFYIGHSGGIVLHQDVKIGRDCNLSQGVTIGLSSRGRHFGVPTIGERVYIGPGAKIFGNITIGDDVAIGANAVVTRDVPSGSVVIGAPARVVSDKGSDGYICHTDYGDPSPGAR